MHIYEERATKVEEQGRQALSPTIRLHPKDDVVIARHHLPEGAGLLRRAASPSAPWCRRGKR